MNTCWKAKRNRLCCLQQDIPAASSVVYDAMRLYNSGTKLSVILDHNRHRSKMSKYTLVSMIASGHWSFTTRASVCAMPVFKLSNDPACFLGLRCRGGPRQHPREVHPFSPCPCDLSYLRTLWMWLKCENTQGSRTAVKVTQVLIVIAVFQQPRREMAYQWQFHGTATSFRPNVALGCDGTSSHEDRGCT